MVVCGECSELYRRVHWKNHGCTSIVWRCISRIEPSRAAMNCINRTVKEDLLQKVTVKAFNRILTDSDRSLRQMQENIAKAIMDADTMSPDGIKDRLEELQKAHREDHRLCRPLHRGIQARHHNRHQSIGSSPPTHLSAVRSLGLLFL